MVRWWKVIQRWLVEAPTLVGWSVVISSGQPHQSFDADYDIGSTDITNINSQIDNDTDTKVEEMELYGKGSKRWSCVKQSHNFFVEKM